MANDYVNQVAEKLVAALEAGTAPWQKPWTPGERFLPFNPTTGNNYRGVNAMWLSLQGYSDSRWMTYRQAAAVGGQVNKGEKGTLVEYWQWKGQEPVKDDQGRPVLDSEGKKVTRTVEYSRPRVMRAVVFNAEQITGLEPPEPRPVPAEWERHQRAEAILSRSPAAIRHVFGDGAYYEPGADRITLPERTQFDTADRYYATALHEVGHSTGHASRLGRDLSHPFGSEEYAREELVAEIMSLMVGDELGIGHDPGQHVAYVGSWIKRLKENPREIFQAAAEAEKASRFVLGLEKEQEVEQQREPATPRQALQRKQAQWDARWDQLRETTSLTPEQIEAALEREFTWTAAEQRMMEWDALMPVAAVERRAELRGDATIDPDDIDAMIEKEFSVPRTVSDQREVATERVDLNVPYSEKNAAKQAGARWDKVEKTWYAPAGSDLTAMSQWLAPAPELPLSPEEEFRVALESHGLIIEGLPVMDGTMQRVPVKDDRRSGAGSWQERSGAYTGYLDGHPAGFIQNHRTGKKENWKSQQKAVGLTASDRARLEAESIQRKADREAALQAGYENAAEGVERILAGTEAAPAHHKYLKAKDLPASGVLIMRGAHAMPPGDDEPQRFGGDNHLAIPAHDIDGKVWTVQGIAPDGRKSFPKGARLAGCHHLIGDLAGDGPILFAEGWATARDLNEQTGLATVACFNANNLEAVAREYRARYPDRALVIAGDNDHMKEAEIDPVTNEPKPNVGKTKAIAAAQAVDGYALLPSFPVGARGSDWNDLRRVRGAAEQMQQLRTGLAVAVRRERASEITRSRGSEREGPDEDLRRDRRKEVQRERAGEPARASGRDDDRRDRTPAIAAGLSR